jgi:NAD(P)-dependent dehydrogenase (short-subunit alcohol dehydrogenase family)
VATPLLKDKTATGIMSREIERTPVGRIGEMDEIADAITFLVSPMSSYMNGAGLVVDG